MCCVDDDVYKINHYILKKFLFKIFNPIRHLAMLYLSNIILTSYSDKIQQNRCHCKTRKRLGSGMKFCGHFYVMQMG